MIRDTLSGLPSVRKSSQCCWLVLAACLLAGSTTSTPMQCTCWKEIYTARCVGCRHLPASLPVGVSRLNMTGNRVSHIHFAASVLPALSDVTSLYLNDNIVSSLKSKDLSPLKRLMVLDLSANNLQTIEENSIACNDQLKRLVLNNNPRLHLVALRSQSLEDLYVENCRLTSFDHSLLRHLPALRALYLRGNDDLPCAQEAQDLRKHYPHLSIYCDVKTTATKTSTTTITSHPAARANIPKSTMSSDIVYVPRFGNRDVPFDGLPANAQDGIPLNIRIVAPIPIVPIMIILIVPLILILAVVLGAVIFRCCLRRGRDSRPRDESEEWKTFRELR